MLVLKRQAQFTHAQMKKLEEILNSRIKIQLWIRKEIKNITSVVLQKLIESNAYTLNGWKLPQNPI